MSRVFIRRVIRLERQATDALPAKPWFVAMPGRPAPDPLPAKFGGVIQVKVFDGRKGTHDHKSDV
jgi:hypothetical protein